MIVTAPPMVTAFELLAHETATQALNTARVVEKPTSDEVRTIIETVYFASLAREEGRLLRLRVGFVAAEGSERPTKQSWGWWTLPFETPLPFEKNELVKLAPSVDSRQSVIAVMRSDDGLRIWGLVNNGASSVNLHEGRTTRSSTTGPEFVNVEALTPGVLDIRIGSGWSRRFVDGDVDKSPVHPFRYPNGPLADISKCGSTAACVTLGLWTRTLRLLLAEMQRARHGGTLLLHAGGEGNWSDRDLRLKRRVHGEGLVLTDACHTASSREVTFDHDFARMTMMHALQPRFPPLTGDEFPPLTGDDACRMVMETSRDVHGEWLDALRWVASLAAIDGALLLSWTFGVRAFGVIVESVNHVEITHAAGRQESDWKPFPWDRFGTRHQSAAAYCRSHPESAAIVVSQDGPISLFRYHGGRVVVWRPCELLDLGAEQ